VQVLAWPILSLILVTALWYWVNSTINTEKQNIEQKALEEAAQLSVDYEKYLTQIIDQANQITLQLQYNWEKSQGKLNLSELSQGGIFRSAAILNVIIIDRKGWPVTSTFPIPKDVTYADRDYFVFHKNDDANFLLVGRPIVSRSRNTPAITFTRRLNTPHGEFAGVVDVAFDPAYLTSFFAGDFPGKSGLLAVAGLDGVLRSIRIGNQPQNSTLPALRTIPLFATPDGATYLSEDSWSGDKQSRYVGWRTLKGYPLVAMVGIPEMEYFAPYQATWSTYRSAAIFASLITFLFAIVATGMSLRIAMKKFQEREQRKAYRIATEGGNEGFYMYEALHDKNRSIVDFQLIDCNLRGAEFYGVTQTQLLKSKLSSFYPAIYFNELIKVFLSAMNSGFYEDEIEVSPESMLKIGWAKRRFVRSGNGLAITIQNITERKQTEDALHLSSERLHLATRVANIGIWDWDIVNDQLVWEDSMYRLYGIRKEDFGGAYDAWIRTILPEDKAHTDGEIQAALRGEREYAPEFRIVRSDGTIRYIKADSQTTRDPEGKPLRMVGTNIDITERKQVEVKILTLNQELEQRVAERTAQLESSNKELEAFSYSISHDLRSPLRAIDGFCHILLEDYTDKLDDEGKRVLNVVRDNTIRMGQLIDDILKFSRTGRLEMSTAEINMEKLAHEVFEELLPAVDSGKLQLEIDAIPPAMGDRAMMRQVFVNLLSNAIKFSSHKEPATIKVGGTIKGNEAVYFVQDNGAGFDMQYADKLFGVFQRLHSTNEFEGTGIGLAIVKRIITRHGGRVWAEGKVNEGAIIYFALPIK
jgi:PAS domain S-box-containing protein